MSKLVTYPHLQPALAPYRPAYNRPTTSHVQRAAKYAHPCWPLSLGVRRRALTHVDRTTKLQCRAARRPTDLPLREYAKGCDTGPPMDGAGSLGFCGFSGFLILSGSLPAFLPSRPHSADQCSCGGNSVDRAPPCEIIRREICLEMECLEIKTGRPV